VLATYKLEEKQQFCFHFLALLFILLRKNPGNGMLSIWAITIFWRGRPKTKYATHSC